MGSSRYYQEGEDEEKTKNSVSQPLN